MYIYLVWFGTFFIFHGIWDNPSHWLIFSEGFKPATIYICIYMYIYIWVSVYILYVIIYIYVCVCVWLFLFLYIYISLESPLPFVFGVVCKTHLFWVRLILFGVVSCKKGLYFPSRCWLYTISITKLNHVSVLCLSCLMLDQAPSHIIQTQAHN